MTVSPPTRGWTSLGGSSSLPPIGFPAHAGMDLHDQRRRGSFTRFPRPRGDGPCMTADRRGVKPVSPPTRGWTLLCRRGRLARSGFPAHAGMDPEHSTTKNSRTRFPRPRGDGPSSATERDCSKPVSPPTRGWTLAGVGGAAPLRGFPAHAGMDLSQFARWSGTPRFPRPRGDGPQEGPSYAAIVSVSPPTRGWTYDSAQHEHINEGFPAHAGMDPTYPNRRNG